MSPDQLAQLLVGIAKSQAALLEAISATLDKSPVPALKQAAQNSVHALLGGQNKKAITLELLPAKLLEAALAPGSLSYREIQKTAQAEVSRLLK